jgi:hypothetical protein
MKPAKFDAAGASGPTEDTPLTRALAEHHEGLERALEAIATMCELGQAERLRVAWNTVERELVHHLDIEDHCLLGLFEAVQPHDARGLRDEHQVLRATLFELSLAVDLGQLEAERVRAFNVQLAEHGARESEILYPWLERHAGPEVWRSLHRHVRLVN